jgi:hypothetical protein
MKKYFGVVSVLLFALVMNLTASQNLYASPTSQPQVKTKGKSQLGTSFRFDGSNLSGKYQNSPGTTAMIEDDKFIDDLLGARKNFTDRINKDRARN